MTTSRSRCSKYGNLKKGNTCKCLQPTKMNSYGNTFVLVITYNYKPNTKFELIY